MSITDQRAAWAVDRVDGLWKCPNGRYAVQAGYMLSGFGRHRDSDALARANWMVAERLLHEAAGITDHEPGDLPVFSISGDEVYTEPVILGSWGHWAVGWVEELLIRVDNDAVTRCAYELHTYVTEQYPVLDDELHAEIEWADNHPDADELCYSDDPCDCGRKRA
jgi:hypothetical protein